MAVDFSDFPPIDQEEERLAAYQLQRIVDEASVTKERKMVAECILKRDLHKRGLGPPLTRGEENIIAYSPFGTDAGCHHP